MVFGLRVYIFSTSGVQMPGVWSACCNMRRSLINAFGGALLFPIDRGKGRMLAARFVLCKPKSQIDGIRPTHGVSSGIKIARTHWCPESLAEISVQFRLGTGRNSGSSVKALLGW